MMLKTGAFLASLAASAALAQSPAARRLPEDSILVSRRALTLSFPVDSAILVAKGSGQPPGLGLELVLDMRSLSSWIRLRVAAPLDSATYRSPRGAMGCRALTDTYSCQDSTRVEIANGRLLITVRDSANVALMFASRPPNVFLRTDFGHRGTRVVVHYIDPQLLPPSKEALAEYDLALGRDRWGPWDRRILTASFGGLDPVFIQTGDRTTVYVIEEQGRPIDSQNSRSDFSASGWRSSDASVVALEPVQGPGVSMMIHALRPGKSTVTVEGLHGPSDDLPRSTRVRTLSRNIVVTPRLARVEITPRPATIVAGSHVQFAARAIDETGAVVPGADVSLYVIYDTPVQYGGFDGKRYDLAERADLTTPGHRRFIARFLTFADTLDLQVVPRTAPPRD